MKNIIIAAVALLLFSGLAVASGGGLDSFLTNLNIQARSDMNGFSVKLGAQFGIPGAQVQAVISSVKEPADAFMVFQLGQMTGKPAETVVQIYKSNKGKGWGVIAKELGIKPGSREFHALKNGDLSFGGEPADGPGKGRGKGKGRGHNQ